MERLSAKTQPCELHHSVTCQLCSILNIRDKPLTKIEKDEGPKFREIHRICQQEKAIIEQAIRTIIDTHPSDVALTYQGIQEALLNSHRTLQQATVRILLLAIADLLVWMGETEQCDLRNEAACKLGKPLQDLLEAHPLPFI